jgi:hypothetical protein
MTRLLRGLVPVLCLGFAACPHKYFSFERPTATLVSVQVTGLGLQGGALNLLLDVHNPNAYDLQTTRIAVGVDLEDTHFGDVDLARGLVLKGRETTPVEIPLTFTWAGVGAGARGLLGHGAVRYGLTGRLWLDTPIGAREVQLAGTGQVTLRDLVRD